jgi:ABC-type lipoprotein export system ATPase subunit
MSSTPILACVDLQKTYSMGRVDVPVLNGITLEVRQGEVLGLVGASGAGKSTLLHLLGLLDVPTSGAVSAARRCGTASSASSSSSTT